MTTIGRNLFGIALGVAIGVCIQQVQALPGTSIGYGQNPLVSIGGSAYDAETKVLFTAPADQDIIVKDLILTSFSNIQCKRGHKSELIWIWRSCWAFETSNGALVPVTILMSNGLSIQHAPAVCVFLQVTLTFVVTQTDVDGYCFEFNRLWCALYG